MKFSIIVPVYKVENYLERCINSILSQNYKNYELILVDDGSPDDSGIICDNYSRRDNRITVIHQNNQGLSTARNNGVAMASGDYIIFLDSDDYWANNSCLSLSNINLNESKADILFLSSQKILNGHIVKLFNGVYDRNLLINKTKSEALTYLLKKGLWKACAWDKVVKRDLFINYDLTFQNGRLCEDQVWCAKLLLLAQNFDSIENISHCYCIRKASISNSINTKIIHDILSNFNDSIELTKKLDKQNNITPLVYAYLSFEYLILLSIFYIKEEVQTYEYLQQYSFLLKYGLQIKIKIIYIIYHIFGLNVLIDLLHFIKRKRI